MSAMTGTIVEVDRRKGHHVRVKLDGDASVRLGDTVSIRKVVTDEFAGRRLRAMFEGIEVETIEELAREISDTSGWPVLADLIREVTIEAAES